MNNKVILEDGLIVPEVGIWSQKKYRLIQNYAWIFATGMKNKWDCRVYIDLFAGAGRVRIKDTQRIVDSSPLLALDIPDKFDFYLFCDKDSTQLEALKLRIENRFPTVCTDYIDGDVNIETEKIVRKVPKAEEGFKVLSFCVVDPYKMADHKFSTIEIISKFYIDFLVLVPTHMDAQRNEKKYSSPKNNTISGFLGVSNWREDWRLAKEKNIPFSSFILESFSKQMNKLGYRSTEIHDSELITYPGKNVPLYRLAFYSRSKVGIEFWEQARKYANPQRQFDFLWKE